MFTYNIKLAIRSLKDNWPLTVLMIAAIGVGLGIFMTMYTQAYQGDKVPLPHKSHQLFAVQMDNRETTADAVSHFSDMVDLTYQDTFNLMASSNVAKYQALAWNSYGIINIDDKTVRPLRARLSVTTNEFFPMFEVPFLYGSGWNADADRTGQAVVVLSSEANQQLFGGSNSVGKQVRINTSVVTVIGVLDDWYLPRRFYDRSFRTASPDHAFIPNNFAIQQELPRNARFDCWSTITNPGQFRTSQLPELLSSECAWVSYWAQIDNGNIKEYQQFIDQYVESQKLLGRFPRPLNNYITSLDEQVNYINGRSNNGAFLMLIAIMFFIVCLVNAVGILLAKFLRKTKEVSLRRALGAKKSTIIFQHLVEVIFIGILGGILGLLLSYAGLHGMLKLRLYAMDYVVSAENMAPYYQLDLTMVATAFIVSIIGTVIIGLYPILRVCNVLPAAQLKAQ